MFIPQIFVGTHQVDSNISESCYKLVHEIIEARATGISQGAEVVWQALTMHVGCCLRQGCCWPGAWRAVARLIWSVIWCGYTEPARAFLKFMLMSGQ